MSLGRYQRSTAEENQDLIGVTMNTPAFDLQSPSIAPPPESPRCERTIPPTWDSTGENAVLCNALADLYCEDCGWLCQTCADEIRCFARDGRHRPTLPHTPTPLARIACQSAANEIEERQKGGAQ